MEPLSAPTWRVGFLTLREGSPADKQHSRGLDASMCFPKGTTEEPESTELGGQAIKKHSWQEYKGHQDANLDPAWLTWVWKTQRKNKKIM